MENGTKFEVVEKKIPVFEYQIVRQNFETDYRFSKQMTDYLNRGYKVLKTLCDSNDQITHVLVKELNA